MEGTQHIRDLPGGQQLLQLLEEAERLSAEYTGGYSNRFLSAEEFHAALSDSIARLKAGDTSQLQRLRLWFAPTCDWDDLVGKEGIALANTISELLDQLEKTITKPNINMEASNKSEKRNRIIYWIATIWMCLGMSVSGTIQVLHLKEETDNMLHLGYPVYFMTIIGVWKLLGVITVLLPKFPLLKEWAYAGFFFTMSGALISHIASGDPAKEFFGPSLLLVLTVLSWYFRPAGRRISAA